MPITFAYNRELAPSAPFVQATICAESEVSVYALIDSGADVTMLPESILNQIEAMHVRSQTLRGVTGHPIIVETYLVDLSFDDNFIKNTNLFCLKYCEIALFSAF